MSVSRFILGLGFMLFAAGAVAQDRPPYGQDVNLELAKKIAAGAAAGMDSPLGAGVSAVATAACSLPLECGMRPVIAATPTAETTITETAAAATRGCSLRVLVFASIASFSFRIANNAQVKGGDDALQ